MNELFEAGRFEPHFNNHINLRLILKVFPQKRWNFFMQCYLQYNFNFFLENQLKKHLGDIFTENQNAFNPGRMIIIILLSHMRYSTDWSSLRNKLNHIWGLKQIWQRLIIVWNENFLKSKWGLWGLLRSEYIGSLILSLQFVILFWSMVRLKN